MEAMHLLDNWRKVISICKYNKGHVNSKKLVELSLEKHWMKCERTNSVMLAEFLLLLAQEKVSYCSKAFSDRILYIHFDFLAVL